MDIFDQIRAIKEQHKNMLLNLPNVCGIGIGYRITAGRMTGELSIMILVRKKLPKAGLGAKAVAPQEIQGVRTDVLQVGDIRALQLPTERWRPAPGGVSLGHYKMSTGTLGCTVYDRTTGEVLILSNNHVAANINDAQIGDPILQPGAADGGSVDKDTIARLEKFVPIDFGTEPATCNLANAFVTGVNLFTGLLGSSHQVETFQYHPNASNLIDAAVARPVDEGDIKTEILEIGELAGVKAAALGMNVRKFGRTTGLTSGEITVLDTTVSVNYGSGLAAIFDDQIVTTAMSQGGDSGSLLVAGDSRHALGLLFAGSEESTIHNPIQTVFDQLNLSLLPNRITLEKGMNISVEDIQKVKETYQKHLMSKANVVGVGVGLRHTGGKRTDDLALIVMVSKKIPRAQLAPEDLIPKQIEGVPVDVKEVGQLEAF